MRRELDRNTITAVNNLWIFLNRLASAEDQRISICEQGFRAGINTTSMVRDKVDESVTNCTTGDNPESRQDQNSIY